MPFTPFHFGPGMLIKGLIPKQFSLSVFALANIAMDVEPLYHILRGDTQLHGASHTLLGATLIGAATALAAPSAITRTWQWFQKFHVDASSTMQLTRQQAWMGALLGTGSHLLLDAIMHRDMHLLLPFSDANPLLKPEWTQNVYLACVLAGMTGMLISLLRAGWKLKQSR